MPFEELIINIHSIQIIIHSYFHSVISKCFRQMSTHYYKCFVNENLNNTDL